MPHDVTVVSVADWGRGTCLKTKIVQQIAEPFLSAGEGNRTHTPLGTRS